ncbi:MAG: hypothetical protein M3525_11925, partial [Acidobacteriota bacterium]|nr:hypothetical protein [Acidobacteriota bacterium]
MFGNSKSDETKNVSPKINTDLSGLKPDKISEHQISFVFICGKKLFFVARRQFPNRLLYFQSSTNFCVKLYSSYSRLQKIQRKSQKTSNFYAPAGASFSATSA